MIYVLDRGTVLQTSLSYIYKYRREKLAQQEAYKKIKFGNQCTQNIVVQIRDRVLLRKLSSVECVKYTIMTRYFLFWKVSIYVNTVYCSKITYTVLYRSGRDVAQQWLEALRSDKRKANISIRLGYILVINMDSFQLLWFYTCSSFYSLDLG